ncbi:MAG: type I-C CRISPR-associated protein Cas7/Csd2 [Elusimicrobiota bacterium]
MSENKSESLKNKIDFAVVFGVKNANPNGDPLNGNRPRVNYDGYGEVSDVCIKRKIRNRLKDLGCKIFVQSDDNRDDDCRSLKERADKILADVMGDEKKLREKACAEWIDVRAFGQLFAFKADKKSKKIKKNSEVETESQESGVSIGIRGPVSIHSAFSVISVNDRVESIQIVKSVSGEGDGSKRGSDTMGMKHRVDHGVYVFFGTMNTQLASKTGFSDSDAESIKKALQSMFQNDASSARPDGSMEILKVVWWKHNCPHGQYSSAQVHRSLKVEVKKDVVDPKSFDDYDIKVDDQKTPGLEYKPLLDGAIFVN